MEIGFAHEERRGREFISKIEDKRPIFVCILGNTETAKIPGVSAAGAFPEITDFTPAADAELLFLGRCESIDGVPVTPDGVPTPALITMSALQLIDATAFIVEGGLRVKPSIPYFSLGGSPGQDIRTGRAVKDVEKIMVRGEILGKNLAKSADYLVIGESIAGGTTTALGVLSAMGIEGKVSSSMPNNPHRLKEEIVEKGMKNADIKFGDLKDNPIGAIEALGDPMMPAFAGVVLGAAEEVPVLMAGGTQMTSILAVVNALNEDAIDNLAIGTTKWIVEDKTSDLIGTIKWIADVPVIYSKLSFEDSKFEGLRAYEKGVVKEGVGAGGAAIMAIVKNVTNDILFGRIEENYERLLSLGG